MAFITDSGVGPNAKTTGRQPLTELAIHLALF